jgi:hypothetical protein
MIGLWSSMEFQDPDGEKNAIMLIMPAAFRLYAILGIFDDSCKIFTGNFLGASHSKRDYHGGVNVFSSLWSLAWVYELIGFLIVVVYYFVVYKYSQYEGNGYNDNSFIDSHFSQLCILGLDFVGFLNLMTLVAELQTHQMEILSFCFRLQSDAGGDSDKYSTIYNQLYSHFDRLKMLMAAQCIKTASNFIPMIQWIAPEYMPNPVTVFFMFIIPVSLPFIYDICSIFARPENKTSETRFVTVWVVFFMGVLCASVIGGFRGCQKILDLEDLGIIDFDNVNVGHTFMIYLAKANALPTTFGFAVCFITSPAAARFSASWHGLPFILRVILAPFPWLSPHLLQQLHIAGGAIYFFGGTYHFFCWIAILALRILSRLTTGLWFCIPTGVILIAGGLKLIWPPGMTGLSECLRCFKIFVRVENFLKDSKYGNWHVYTSNIVLVTYCAHASVSLGFMDTPYWLFAFFCASVLYLLHPTKSTYFAAKVLQPLKSLDAFNRKYTTLGKTAKPIRRGTLSDVKLRLALPTYDVQFDEVLQNKEYTGYCDVILIKFRDPANKWSREMETVHYYSTVNVRNLPDADNQMEASLMIQKTRRPGGCSAALMDATDTLGEKIEVIGFLKSNALESVYAPALIGFAWESGAAAFCSIFKKRRSRELDEGGVLNFDSRASAVRAKTQDLLVVWTTFCRRPRDGVMTAKVVGDAVRELVKLQTYLHEQAGKNGVKIICVATGVPPEWTPSSENLLSNCATLDTEVAQELNIVQETARAWNDLPSIDDNEDEEDDEHYAGESLAETFRSSVSIVKNNLIPRQSSSAGEANMSTELMSKRSSSTGVHTRPSLLNPTGRESLATAAAPTPEETIFRLQNRPESWVSVRDALTRKWKHVCKTVDERVGASIQWMNSEGGPDCTTFFVPEHQSDSEALKQFKYNEIYDEVNRSIIENQLRYQKNPNEFVDGVLGDDNDPMNPNAITAHVLYSGDYASSKLDSLKSVVDRVSVGQSKLRVPASLEFVPDA